MLRRFRREALLTARLDHPGVPAVYDLGEHHGRPYLVLQKIDGITLADLIAEQRPAADRLGGRHRRHRSAAC